MDRKIEDNTESESLLLQDLPTEILVSVLSNFETRTLLPLIIVSRRFHSVILRILHFRLLTTAEMPDYKVILEAFHPSRRYTDPYLFCTYLGTDGLSSKHEGLGSLYEDCNGATGRFAKLGTLYSRFRPERPGIAGSMPLRRIAGATINQPLAGSSTQPIYKDGGDGGSMKVIHHFNLDQDELFGQFCAYANLVRTGPRRGVFLSTVQIVEPGQGVMRVWREWLWERARRSADEDNANGSDLERSTTYTFPMISDDKAIMWTDYRKNVGLRVSITHRGEPACSYEDEPADDTPLNVAIEIRELVVRTTHLMLAVEKSAQEQHNRSGKALIFGNFATALS